MSTINKVIIIGNVGRDPEIRSTQGGDRIANLSVATSERWRDKGSGEWKEKTEWHRVTVFDDKLCEVIEKYVKKGSKLYLEGQLQTRKWTDKDGNDKFTTEIVLQKFRGQLQLLDSRDGGGDERPAPAAQSRGVTPRQAQRPLNQDLDDEIPF